MSKDLLAKTALFGALTEAQIAAVHRRLRVRKYSAGTCVVREGEEGEEMFIVRSGQVTISKAIQMELPGRGELCFEKRLATLGEGSYFGEVALLASDTRSATVTAVTDLELWVLTTDDMKQLMEADVALVYRVLAVISKELCNRLHTANEDLRKLITAFAFAINR